MEPLHIGTRLTEELQLHLLELSGTEGKVTRRNLVTEGLTDLTDTERNLLTGGSLNILKVYENTLRGLRTKINRVSCILGNALEGLKHQVKLTDIGKILLAAARTANAVLCNVILHLLVAPAVYAAVKGNAILCSVILD